LLEGKKSILKEDGTSLIIHEGKDDGVTQPGGDAGPRIICGELKANPKNDNTDHPQTRRNKTKGKKRNRKIKGPNPKDGGGIFFCSSIINRSYNPINAVF